MVNRCLTLRDRSISKAGTVRRMPVRAEVDDEAGEVEEEEHTPTERMDRMMRTMLPTGVLEEI